MFAEEFQLYQNKKLGLDRPGKRYVNPLRRALRWKAILDRESHLNNTLLAKRLGMSRVRIVQCLSLLRLPQWAQEKILNTTGVSERALRPLIQIQNERVFKAAFQEILEQAMSPQNRRRNGSNPAG